MDVPDRGVQWIYFSTDIDKEGNNGYLFIVHTNKGSCIGERGGALSESDTHMTFKWDRMLSFRGTQFEAVRYI